MTGNCSLGIAIATWKFRCKNVCTVVVDVCIVVCMTSPLLAVPTDLLLCDPDRGQDPALASGGRAEPLLFVSP